MVLRRRHVKSPRRANSGFFIALMNLARRGRPQRPARIAVLPAGVKPVASAIVENRLLGITPKTHLRGAQRDRPRPPPRTAERAARARPSGGGRQLPTIAGVETPTRIPSLEDGDDAAVERFRQDRFYQEVIDAAAHRFLDVAQVRLT